MDVDAIRARVEAASDGPWEMVEWSDIVVVRPDGTAVVPENDFDDPFIIPGDMAFIAHAREDVPALLSALDQSLALLREAVGVGCVPVRSAVDWNVDVVALLARMDTK